MMIRTKDKQETYVGMGCVVVKRAEGFYIYPIADVEEPMFNSDLTANMDNTEGYCLAICKSLAECIENIEQYY